MVLHRRHPPSHTGCTFFLFPVNVDIAAAGSVASLFDYPADQMRKRLDDAVTAAASSRRG